MVSGFLRRRLNLLKKMIRICRDQAITLQRHNFGHQLIQAEFRERGIIEQDESADVQIQIAVQEVLSGIFVSMVAVDVAKTEGPAKTEGSSENIRADMPFLPCVKKLICSHLKGERQIVPAEHLDVPDVGLFGKGPVFGKQDGRIRDRGATIDVFKIPLIAGDQRIVNAVFSFEMRDDVGGKSAKSPNFKNRRGTGEMADGVID